MSETTIKKEYFFFFIIFLVLAVAIGYSFGADAGYKKGLEDGGHQPTASVPITGP